MKIQVSLRAQRSNPGSIPVDASISFSWVGTEDSEPGCADWFPRWSMGTREGTEHGNQGRAGGWEPGDYFTPGGVRNDINNRTIKRSRCHCERSEAIPADASVSFSWVGPVHPSPFLVPMLWRVSLYDTLGERRFSWVGTEDSEPGCTERFPRWSMGTREYIKKETLPVLGIRNRQGLLQVSGKIPYLR